MLPGLDGDAISYALDTLDAPSENLATTRQPIVTVYLELEWQILSHPNWRPSGRIEAPQV